MTSFTLTQSEKQKLKQEMLGNDYMKKKQAARVDR